MGAYFYYWVLAFSHLVRPATLSLSICTLVLSSGQVPPVFKSLIAYLRLVRQVARVISIRVTRIPTILLVRLALDPWSTQS